MSSDPSQPRKRVATEASHASNTSNGREYSPELQDAIVALKSYVQEITQGLELYHKRVMRVPGGIDAVYSTTMGLHYQRALDAMSGLGEAVKVHVVVPATANRPALPVSLASSSGGLGGPGGLEANVEASRAPPAPAPSFVLPSLPALPAVQPLLQQYQQQQQQQQTTGHSTLTATAENVLRRHEARHEAGPGAVVEQNEREAARPPPPTTMTIDPPPPTFTATMAMIGAATAAAATASAGAIKSNGPNGAVPSTFIRASSLMPLQSYSYSQLAPSVAHARGLTALTAAAKVYCTPTAARPSHPQPKSQSQSLPHRGPGRPRHITTNNNSVAAAVAASSIENGAQQSGARAFVPAASAPSIVPPTSNSVTSIPTDLPAKRTIKVRDVEPE